MPKLKLKLKAFGWILEDYAKNNRQTNYKQYCTTVAPSTRHSLTTHSPRTSQYQSRPTVADTALHCTARQRCLPCGTPSKLAMAPVFTSSHLKNSRTDRSFARITALPTDCHKVDRPRAPTAIKLPIQTSPATTYTKTKPIFTKISKTDSTDLAFKTVLSDTRFAVVRQSEHQTSRVHHVCKC